MTAWGPRRRPDLIRGVLLVGRAMPFPNPDTQFKPGYDPRRNTAGRGKSLASRLRRRLEHKAKNSDRELADLVVDALIRRAVKGDVRAIKEVFNRVDGKVPNPIAYDEGSGVQSIRAALFGVEDDPEMTPEEIAASDEKIAREIIMRAGEEHGVFFDDPDPTDLEEADGDGRSS